MSWAETRLRAPYCHYDCSVLSTTRVVVGAFRVAAPARRPPRGGGPSSDLRGGEGASDRPVRGGGGWYGGSGRVGPTDRRASGVDGTVRIALECRDASARRATVDVERGPRRGSAGRRSRVVDGGTRRCGHELCDDGGEVGMLFPGLTGSRPTCRSVGVVGVTVRIGVECRDAPCAARLERWSGARSAGRRTSEVGDTVRAAVVRWGPGRGAGFRGTSVRRGGWESVEVRS